MTFSDVHKVIFFHLLKTGGESINHSLRMKKAHMPVRCLFDHDYRQSLEKNFRWINSKFLVVKILRRWSTHKRFTVVRNPWDRVVSEYCYNVSKGIENRTFEKAVYDLREEDIIWKASQYTWLNYNGLIQSDLVLRFENLQADFNKFIHEDIHLPKINSTPHDNYRNFYNSDTKKIVESVYIDDVETWKYKF